MKNLSVFRALSRALFSLSKTVPHCKTLSAFLAENQPMNIVASEKSFNKQSSLRGKATAAEAIQESMSLEKRTQKAAFSLVEMLMALLVASLLLAALAPVMTRKMNEELNINGQFDPKTNTTKKEILYGSEECPVGTTPNVASDGSEYCEGTYTVPSEYNGVIKVTVIGAGGGGGVAPTAGLTEYTSPGSSTFTVPAMVNQLEATLVSGGAGGGGGGITQKTETFAISGTPSGDNGTLTTVSTGEGVWKPSSALNNAWVRISACGGGGGGVIGSGYGPVNDFANPGHGGYFLNKMFMLPSNASSGLSYRIGGRGAHFVYGSNTNYAPMSNGGATAVYRPQGCINAAAGGSGNSLSGNGSNSCCYDTASPTPSADGSPLCIADGGTAPSGAGNGGRGGKGPKEHSWGSRSTGGGAGSLQGFGGQGGEGSHSAAAGGGGGGSTWLGGTLATPNLMVFQVGGGGGGVGPASNFSGVAGIFPAGGGGGGGAGMAGYEGGNGAGAALGSASMPATSGGGATTSPVFGTGYCLGGTSGKDTDTISPSAAEAKNGAMRISYIDYGTGASGGGAGNIVPIQRVLGAKLKENTTIYVKVGAGGAGGQAGSGYTSGGSYSSPGIGTPNYSGNELRDTVITDEQGSVLLTTYTGQYGGGWGGHPNGVVAERTSGGGSTLNWQRDQAAIGGGIYKGVLLPSPPYQTRIDENSSEKIGFSSGNGWAAGDVEKHGYESANAASGTKGGRGGTLVTPWYTCTPGAGGTSNNKNGSNGAGGGCGGGGGYSFGKGGDGGHGYARLSWNKHWDVALNSGKGGYKLANTGTGGGGASGNIMTYSIKVMGNQAIRIRIGKGGSGATIVNNTVVNAKKGGDTVFGDGAIGEIKAGGGGGGGNPLIVNNALVNGTGGIKSTICHYGSKSFLKNKAYCTEGTAGLNAEPSTDNNQTAKGARGASLATLGTGGEGGISGTNAYEGKPAEGIGSGGGGAGIYDLGDNSVNSLSGTNQGGMGSHGKIIIELYDM